MNASEPILVVGGGIAGITCALEIAATGLDVVLVERSPTLGGHVLHNYRYFPKMCPPSCGLEINLRRLESDPHIRVVTQTEVVSATETEHGWSVVLSGAPVYVKRTCTACGACNAVCPTGAIRLVHPCAWPQRYVIDGDPCPINCAECIAVCQYDAIDLDARPVRDGLDVAAVVLATGWEPYPLANLPEYGGGQFVDVLTNVALEKLASGEILRPSTRRPPERVAFVQCAGSRDRHHLSYCSAVCCMVALKQAVYVHSRIPEAQITIYYIDLRAPGYDQELLDAVAALGTVELIRGKVSKIEKDDLGLTVLAEDVLTGKLLRDRADLVVLATGMVSNARTSGAPFDLQCDADGFGVSDPARRLFVSGVARRPGDVLTSLLNTASVAASATAVAIGRS